MLVEAEKGSGVEGRTGKRLSYSHVGRINKAQYSTNCLGDYNDLLHVLFFTKAKRRVQRL